MFAAIRVPLTMVSYPESWGREELEWKVAPSSVK